MIQLRIFAQLSLKPVNANVMAGMRLALGMSGDALQPKKAAVRSDCPNSGAFKARHYSPALRGPAPPPEIGDPDLPALHARHDRHRRVGRPCATYDPWRGTQPAGTTAIVNFACPVPSLLLTSTSCPLHPPPRPKNSPCCCCGSAKPWTHAASSACSRGRWPC